MLPSIITKNHRPNLPIDPEPLPQSAVQPPVQLDLFRETLRYARLAAPSTTPGRLLFRADTHSQLEDN